MIEVSSVSEPAELSRPKRVCPASERITKGNTCEKDISRHSATSVNSVCKRHVAYTNPSEKLTAMAEHCAFLDQSVLQEDNKVEAEPRSQPSACWKRFTAT